MLVEHISSWQKYGFGPVWEEVMTWLAQQAADHARPQRRSASDRRLRRQREQSDLPDTL